MKYILFKFYIKMKKNIILIKYKYLLKTYGPQGWWPLLDLHNSKNNKKGCNPTKTGSLNGYHPNDYSYPKTDRQIFEICLGAILTQNTSWTNVEKALLNLNQKNLINPEKIISISIDQLGILIKPTGYFNQKAKKLKEFASFYIFLKHKTPTRKQLLDIWGIGPETADSILLYAYKKPSFVVDAYTRKIFEYDKRISYDQIKQDFETALPKDYKLYQEFHALIVEHAKNTL
jgi:endonuclease III related protein